MGRRLIRRDLSCPSLRRGGQVWQLGK